ncbi:uncharacterized protein METZ01_LOCUS465204 [marine metagenome]|uniref:Uncharacterized protein n=1 Tax=marine metagenome TaxID=408172 RepID=A0A383AXV2_9ZZZZ
MKKLVCLTILFLFSFTLILLSANTESGSYQPSCDTSKTTVCTIEMWLAHKHKKNNREIRKFLKSKSLKVLRHTIQYWKPKGGHPPTNIAIGSLVSAKDARLMIDIAIQYNDKINGLILRPLNPPNYVAIATSAWDEQSEVSITPEELKKLRNPKLTTEEFQALYAELTHEIEHVRKGAKFY